MKEGERERHRGRRQQERDDDEDDDDGDDDDSSAAPPPPQRQPCKTQHFGIVLAVAMSSLRLKGAHDGMYSKGGMATYVSCIRGAGIALMSCGRRGWR